MFVGCLGLVCAYRLALRYSTRGAALLATLGIAWGTFLFWYLTGEPTMSHNLSFATAALTFLLIERRPRGARGWFLVGLSVGFSATVRFANALLGAAALPALVASRGEARGREFVKNALALGLGAFVAFLPQMYAWQQIFGSLLLVPNGEGFLDRPPALLDILFSPHGGLFTWSPLLYLAIPGLIAFRRLGFRTALGFWSVILLLYVTNARVPDWWGGSSFGNRRFCTVLAPLAVGMAITIDALARFARRRPLVMPALLVAAVSLWNVLLAQGHRELAWRWGEAGAFPQMARVVADQVSRSIGSPFSLPGAIAFALSSGEKVADYDASIFRRPYSTFVLRFGLDDAPFLREGFSLPQETGDFLHRTARAGRLEVPIREARDYGMSLRLRGADGQSLRIDINGTPTGSCPLERELRTCEVSAGHLRAGPNTFLLRVQAAGGQVEPAQLHELRLEPRPIP